MTALAHGNFAGKRLVIFGCGYVGGEVARQAVERGVRVTALTRNGATAAALRAIGVAKVVEADLASDDWHGRIAGDAEWVLNAVSSGGGGIESYRQSYVEGMRSILRWARRGSGVDTLVYTSSTSVYPQDGGVTVDETAATEGVGERGEVLLAAERLLREASDEEVRRSFVLRLAGIYGPGRVHLVEQVKTGAVAGRGEHRLNLVHRDDICAAIWAAFSAPAAVGSDVFNVADDGAAPKAEVAAWLAAKLGVAAPTFTGLPAGGRRAVTPDRVIANAKLKRVLGWQPRYASFRESYENILSRGAE
jgi:nucleoside-diphosphate-sugar epimerase